jgi:uncharacterized protein (DUF2384 family)
MDELLTVESPEKRRVLARTLAKRMLARRGETTSPLAVEQKARALARLIRVQARAAGTALR